MPLRLSKSDLRTPLRGETPSSHRVRKTPSRLLEQSIEGINSRHAMSGRNVRKGSWVCGSIRTRRNDQATRFTASEIGYMTVYFSNITQRQDHQFNSE
jgi:hypothetical protein